MIDEAVFKDAWALLCDRFGRQPSTPLMHAYYGSLSPRLSTGQFKAAAQKIFEEREFFPRPADFIEAGLPNAEALALEQWEQVQELMRGFGDREQLTQQSRDVVALLGGLSKLRNTQLENVQWVRKDFLAMYQDMAATARRNGGERIEPTRESLRLTGEIMRKAAGE